MAKQTFSVGQVLSAANMTSLQQTAMGGGSTTAKTTSYVLVAADAGTTVAMNAAGATTITVNTGLFSAGDSVFIQNWGAGVTTITAGTATVTTAGSLALSQWEGGTLYFTSASAAIFFDVVQSSGMTNPMTTAGDTIYGGASGTPTRLAIGSTGNVLTVSGGNPVWAAPASTTFPTFSAYDASTQSINANVYTKITFGTESWDTGSAFATSRFTPQTAGYYIVSGMVGAATGAAEDVYWQVYKNGASWQMGSLIKTTGNNYGSGNILVYLNGSTDYIEIYASSSNNVTIGGGAEKRYFAAIGIRS